MLVKLRPPVRLPYQTPNPSKPQPRPAVTQASTAQLAKRCSKTLAERLAAIGECPWAKSKEIVVVLQTIRETFAVVIAQNQ